MRFGEKFTTMTLHRVDTGIDTGEIVSTSQVPILGPEQQSLFDLRLDLGERGIRMLIEEVDRITEKEQLGATNSAGSLSTSVDHAPPEAAAAEGTYFSWPSMAEYADFASKGFKLWHDKDVDRVKLMFNPSLHQEMSMAIAAVTSSIRQAPIVSHIGRHVRHLRRGLGLGIGVGFLGGGMGTARALCAAAGRRNRTTSFGPATFTKR